ncbi:MAG: DUF6428 family protein [Rhizobiaceae bacterium]
MLVSGNKDFSDGAIPIDPADITIGRLLNFLGDHKGKALVFFYEGTPIKPGYHVTEVKAGKFEALDCGANPESWTEMFIQLWDVNEDRAHMPSGKFSAIIRKVTDHLTLDHSAKLTFEVSDGVRPMQLYRASLPEIVKGEVRVELSPRPASCKPRDRWLDQQKLASNCCEPKPQPCCR